MLELKSRSASLAFNSSLAYNRTMLELKFRRSRILQGIPLSYNRTMLELKSQSGTTGKVL